MEILKYKQIKGKEFFPVKQGNESLPGSSVDSKKQNEFSVKEYRKSYQVSTQFSNPIQAFLTWPYFDVGIALLPSGKKRL